MTITKINSIPRDRANEALQEFPAPVRALASSMRENAVVSSALLMNPNATSLEIAAVANQGVAIRWVRATETPAPSSVFNASVIASGLGANFDHVIPAGTVRRFAIPKETGGVGPQGNVNNQLGSVYGLYQRVAIINAGTGASSVLIAEY